VFHMAGFLGAGSAQFDIRDKAGPTDMLITNAPLGAELAEALGQGVCVLMRGHGATIVGTSLEQAVYRAIYTEVNARLQLQARALGPITYLSAEEAALAAATTESQTFRTWNLWVSRIGPVE
jgi:ribulose-5-phosphate 4-epimerase/fuculose-1-phosphate aldolase